MATIADAREEVLVPDSLIAKAIHTVSVIRERVGLTDTADSDNLLVNLEDFLAGIATPLQLQEIILGLCDLQRTLLVYENAENSFYYAGIVNDMLRKMFFTGSEWDHRFNPQAR